MNSYADFNTNETTMTILYSDLDAELIKNAIPMCVELNSNRKFTKVKTYIDLKQKNDGIGEFLKKSGFIYELIYEKKNDFFEIYSYIL